MANQIFKVEHSSFDLFQLVSLVQSLRQSKKTLTEVILNYDEITDEVFLKDETQSWPHARASKKNTTTYEQKGRDIICS